jgi:hypothetical protein
MQRYSLSAILVTTIGSTSVGRGSSVGKATATGWTVGGSKFKKIPVGRLFRTCLDRPWGPPSLLYSGYRVFPGGKSAGAGCWPPTSRAKGKERVELHLYPRWAFVDCSRMTFTFTQIEALFKPCKLRNPTPAEVKTGIPTEPFIPLTGVYYCVIPET